MSLDATGMKKLVAEEAVRRYVKDGMTIGLGTGSTARFMIEKIGELVKDGYELTCTATSVQSERLAKDLGIKVVDIDSVNEIDVTIDGADEVDPQMQLIKGLGGALLREKIVAAATVKEIIITDESKVVEKLGTKAPLPVEVLKFGNEHTKHGLEMLGCKAELRMAGVEPYYTDSGNLIYDCRFESIEKPFFLEMAIDKIPGVVENGLFLNTAYDVLIAKSDGSIESMAEKISAEKGAINQSILL